MNIMQIVSGTGVNGAIVHCLELARQLSRRGHALTLVVRPNSWIAVQLAGSPVRIVESSLARWPSELRRVAAIARAARIDVAHTHMSSAHSFGVMLRWWFGVPCVATAHNRKLQFHWLFNDRVIACSEATRRFHRRFNRVPERRIETVHNFVDTKVFDALPSNTRTRTREMLGLPDAAPLAGIFGQAIPRKGQLHLVRAWPLVRERVPAARLLVTGDDRIDPDYTAAVRAEAERLGVAAAITWTGHRDEMPSLLAACDLCVCASLEESLPLAVLEAMAAGLPLVATSVGGLPECVVHGETGLLVPPGDEPALGGAIATVLADSNLRERFGQAGRGRIREQFSLDSQLPRIERILAAAAGRRAA